MLWIKLNLVLFVTYCPKFAKTNYCSMMLSLLAKDADFDKARIILQNRYMKKE